MATLYFGDQLNRLIELIVERPNESTESTNHPNYTR